MIDIPKAIAVQAVFLIAVISISLFFFVGIFWGWIGTTKFSVSQATCTAAKTSCCSALRSGTEKCEIDPACSQYNIKEPSLEECCELFKGLSPKCN